MEVVSFVPGAGLKTKSSRRRKIYDSRYLYLLLLPGLIFFIVVKIFPIWGLSIAFVEYNPYGGIAGILKSQFVGFSNFIEVFSDKMFVPMLRNTFIINLLGIIFCFPLPIVLSIMLNEVRHNHFKKITQTLLYFPHFVSWVVVVSLTMFFFSADIGLINKFLVTLGMDKILIMSNPNFFWGLITGQVMWRETGWSTIIVLAAITGIDPQLYEAAVIDGASKWKQIIHVTIPSVAPTIVVLLILRLGHMADVSLEQIILMQNPLLYEVSEVFDTFAFTQGVTNGFISIGVAVGLFKSVVNMIFVVSANTIITKLGQDGIY